MKHEIIFRGKPKSGYDYKEWLYGSLIKIDSQNYGIIEESDISCNSEGYIDYAHTPVKIDTIGQFTGLTDKNGKKVFDGDIINIKEYENLFFNESDEFKKEFPISDFMGKKISEYTDKVVYEECEFMIYDGECGVGLGCFCGDMKNVHPIYEVEIIGNVYDNPELLK